MGEELELKTGSSRGELEEEPELNKKWLLLRRTCGGAMLERTLKIHIDDMVQHLRIHIDDMQKE